MTSCPHCGAGARLGVWLSAKKLRIFDMVEKRSLHGVAWNELGDNRDAVKAHVHQINCLLEETDYAIRGRRGRQDALYKLVKVR